jgi:predicted NAD/FAD-binding protein
MRIAIVGTGISGLVAAHYLAPDHDLTIYEAQSHIGGHTLTSEIDWEGRAYHIDAGFIVFNEVNYPNLVNLFDELGVESQETSMSFSVKCERTGLEYSGSSLNGLFAQRRNLVNPGYLRLLREITRFNREARELLQASRIAPRLGEVLSRGGYSRAFVEQYLIPLGAAIWSTSPDRMLDFPAPFFLRFLENHGLLSVWGHHQWRSVKGGSFRYIEPLTRPFADRIRLSSPVRRIRRAVDSVAVETVQGEVERFDEVVIATHSDQALCMLDDPTEAETEVLGAIPYQLNEAALHTDTSVLPRSRRAWASWNYHVPAESVDRVVVTYNMNELQCLDEGAPIFCVSLNLGDRIAPEKTLRTFHFAHPVFTPEAAAAQQRWSEISGLNRTHYCGAYWGNGFHEDGVNSGLEVAQTISATRMRVVA